MNLWRFFLSVHCACTLPASIAGAAPYAGTATDRGVLIEAEPSRGDSACDAESRSIPDRVRAELIGDEEPARATFGLRHTAQGIEVRVTLDQNGHSGGSRIVNAAASGTCAPPFSTSFCYEGAWEEGEPLPCLQ